MYAWSYVHPYDQRASEHEHLRLAKNQSRLKNKRSDQVRRSPKTPNLYKLQVYVESEKTKTAKTCNNVVGAGGGGGHGDNME